MTEKVASIVPRNHLHLIKDNDYFMALSYACADPRYVQFFRERANEGKYVILDNSTVEAGEPEHFETYVEKAIKMDASEIVMPDWLHEKDRTLADLQRCMPIAMEMEYTGNTMAVPQGNNPSEYLDCAAEMLQYPISTLGISRRYLTMFGGTRTGIAEMVHDRIMIEGRDVESKIPVYIHLLGCWAHPIQDIGTLLRDQYIRGIDGSLASVFALHGQLLEEYAERPGPMIDIINDVYDEKTLTYNLMAWERLCWRGHR